MSSAAERTGVEGGDAGNAAVPDNTAENTAILARALFGHALAAFKEVPEASRAEALRALDRFIAVPSPAAFVAAARELRETRRRIRLESRGSGILRRALAGGIAALHEVPGLPSVVPHRLAADLPIDARTGQRLQALGALARAYEELAGRVAADTAEMRRHYQSTPHKRRPRGLRPPDKRR
jgi:hypothetical protein